MAARAKVESWGDEIRGSEGSEALAGGTRQPRGIRNNNPGNIEYGRFAKSRGAAGSDGRFAKFPTPAQGIAAMYDLQRIYENDRGATTIAQRIGRWAPSTENDTSAYVRTVAAAMGIDPNTPFSINDPTLGPAFVNAVIAHENGGNPYDATVVAGAQGGAQVAGGAPDAATVPLPRVSPAQRAMAQSAPPGTEAVSGSEALPYVEPATGPVAPFDSAFNLDPSGPGGAPTNPPTPAARPGRATGAPAVQALDLEPPRAQPAGLNVRVRKGDTMWDMAQHFYGDGRRWTEISQANQGIAPERLIPGMVLAIPGVEGPPTPGARPVKGAVQETATAPQGRPVAAPAPTLPAAPATPPAAAQPPAIGQSAAESRPAAGAAYGDQYLVPEGQDVDDLTRKAPGVSEPKPAPTVEQLAAVLEERTGNPVTFVPSTDVGAPAVIRSRQAVSAPAEVGMTGIPLARDLQKSRQIFEGSTGPEQLARPAGTPEVQVAAGEESPWKSVYDNPVMNWAQSTVFGPDSAFHGLMLEPDTATAATAAPTSARLDVVPAVPAVPRKDQSRIDPAEPSQQQPATDGLVKAPKDMTTTAPMQQEDFPPLDPSVFQGGRNPAGVSNATLKPAANGLPGTATYRQNGWSISTMGNGVAARTMTTPGSGTQMQMWNPTRSVWEETALPGATTDEKKKAVSGPVKPTSSGTSGWMSQPGLSTQF